MAARKQDLITLADFTGGHSSNAVVSKILAGVIITHVQKALPLPALESLPFLAQALVRIPMLTHNSFLANDLTLLAPYDSRAWTWKITRLGRLDPPKWRELHYRPGVLGHGIRR